MEYDLLKYGDMFEQTNRRYTKRLLENATWYQGIEEDLRYYYRTRAQSFRTRRGYASDNMNFFWYKANNKFRKIHSGVPQLICEKNVDLIIGNGYRIMVNDDPENEERLLEILEDNKENLLLSTGIETETWSGGAPFKVSYNPRVSKYPIIEVVQPENYHYESESGRIVRDIFTRIIYKGDNKYKLTEVYGVDEKGSYITYKLERLSSNKQGEEWKECDIRTLDETKNLTDFRVNGYFKKFSQYKPNKYPNSEFRGCLYGESDYSGSIGAMDALDEVLSSWAHEIRTGKVKSYVPEHLTIKDNDGKSMLPSDFDNEFFVYDGDMQEGADAKFEYSQPDIRTEKFISSYLKWLEIILNNAGMSPQTFGITGFEAISSSADSQQEREKATIRTRNKKVELWTEFLNDFLERVLVFDDAISNMKENGTTTIGEYDVEVVFDDYILKSKMDRTEEVNMDQGKAWDIETSVEYVHEDKTEEERAIIVRNIKIENGIPLTEADIVAEAGLEETETGQEVEDIVEEEVIEEFEEV